MIKPGGGCEETMWKSATVNHTRLTACFPRQLCKLKLNMNKYRARTCMYVHESCLHTLKMLNQRKKKKQNKMEKMVKSNAKAGKITNIYPIQIDAGRAPLAPAACLPRPFTASQALNCCSQTLPMDTLAMSPPV